MIQNAETALGKTGPFPEDMHGGAGLHGAMVPQATDDAQQRERARRQMILDAIREHLGEQPSPHTVRSCGRRWANDINRLADHVADELSKHVLDTDR